MLTRGDQPAGWITPSMLVAFALFGRFLESRAPDFALRLLVALLSFVVMFLPGGEGGSKGIFVPRDLDLGGLKVTADALIGGAAALTLASVAVGVLRHYRLAKPPTALAVDDRVAGGDARELIAEANRDLG